MTGWVGTNWPAQFEPAPDEALDSPIWTEFFFPFLSLTLNFLWSRTQTPTERLEMSGSVKNTILPVSDPPRDQERERLIGVGDDEKLFRGSAMTRRGAYAAISYMACAGKLHAPLILLRCNFQSFWFPEIKVSNFQRNWNWISKYLKKIGSFNGLDCFDMNLGFLHS